MCGSCMISWLTLFSREGVGTKNFEKLCKHGMFWSYTATDNHFLHVGSKIDENHCKQKYKLIQVMGALYRYISYTCTCN